MCGGAGTRLWPMSREGRPKQFLPLFGPESTFQDTIRRVSDPALFARPIVITNNQYRFLVAEQLAAIGVAVGADFLVDRSFLIFQICGLAGSQLSAVDALCNAVLLVFLALGNCLRLGNLGRGRWDRGWRCALRQAILRSMLGALCVGAGSKAFGQDFSRCPHENAVVSGKHRQPTTAEVEAGAASGWAAAGGGAEVPDFGCGAGLGTGTVCAIAAAAVRLARMVHATAARLAFRIFSLRSPPAVSTPCGNFAT